MQLHVIKEQRDKFHKLNQNEKHQWGMNALREMLDYETRKFKFFISLVRLDPSRSRCCHF